MICTNAVGYQFFNDKLNAIVQMRSNDAIYGYKYDTLWQTYVLDRLADELGVMPGDVYWQVMNLHIYDRHKYLIEGAINDNN